MFQRWPLFLFHHTRPEGVSMPSRDKGCPDAVGALALHADFPEDSAHDRHGLLVYLVTVPRSVEFEAEHRAGNGDNLPLLGLAVLAPPRPLGRLSPLELGELVEYAVRELPFGTLVATVVELLVAWYRALRTPPARDTGRLVRGAKRSLSWASTADTPPAATKSRTRSMPGLSRVAPLCPGSSISSATL